jgi:hypothetical protein
VVGAYSVGGCPCQVLRDLHATTKRVSVPHNRFLWFEQVPELGGRSLRPIIEIALLRSVVKDGAARTPRLLTRLPLPLPLSRPSAPRQRKRVSKPPPGTPAKATTFSSADSPGTFLEAAMAHDSNQPTPSLQPQQILMRRSTSDPKPLADLMSESSMDSTKLPSSIKTLQGTGLISSSGPPVNEVAQLTEGGGKLAKSGALG